MKHLLNLFILAGGLLFSSFSVKAQDDAWPKTITANDGSIIKLYEPQPESFTGNILKSRSAISLQQGNADPIFGTVWAVETVETDRDYRLLNVISAKIPNLKFATAQDAATTSYLKTTLESQIPQLNITLSLDVIETTLGTNVEEKKLSKGLKNDPPQIIYSSQPSILVLIDGTPKLQKNSSWGVDAVVNTPFTIVKTANGTFYLYGGKNWYKGPSATGPFTFTENKIPKNLNKIQQDVDNANNADPGFNADSAAAAKPSSPSTIIVSTVPAELVQTKGDPALSPIANTHLSYVSNTQNDLFLNKNDNQYYVLLSGRWYKSAHLQTGWQYTEATSLPDDFAKIPEGSAKDNVLASVAGTDAAREAVMDAQIPQTAKVDRQNASAEVSYDGAPQFQDIQGTNMQYAVNTQSSVIVYRGTYYCVDKGVWFESGSAGGPWSVCTDRPDEVDIIPASYPVYNMKYVYIYDVQPDYVYMGYTPGYLNTYIYNGTVVYGTGYYYTPWYGSYYYPRPCTWGFGVQYNPWFGWSLGFGYSNYWFNGGGYYGGGYYGGGSGYYGGYHGGWWGPAVYRPPFNGNSYGGRGGYYGPGARPGGNVPYGNGNRNNANVPFGNGGYNAAARTNNIYNYRGNVETSNRTTFPTGGQRPAGGGFNNNQGARPPQGGGSSTNQTGSRPPQGGGSYPNNGNAQTGRPAPNNTNEAGRPQQGGGNPTNNNAPAGRPASNGNAQTGARPQQGAAPSNNNITTDSRGNVYQRTPAQNNNSNPQWQQRQQGQWAPVQNNNQQQNLNQQQEMRDRGESRSQNFQSTRSYSPPPQAPSFNGGGGGRPSGGGGAPSGGGGFNGGGGGGGGRPSGGGGRR